MIAETVPRCVFFCAIPAESLENIDNLSSRSRLAIVSFASSMNDDLCRDKPLLHYLHQVAIQSAAVIAVLGITWPHYYSLQEPLPWLAVSILIGSAALLFAVITRQFWWWRAIHAVFAPATYAASKLQLAPEWYLLASATLFLVYRGALSGQIPLYFSNAQSASTLIRYFADSPPGRIIDLGAGIGSVVSPLAKAFERSHVTGVENAYLPWLVGWLRTFRISNCQWSLSNLWDAPLSNYDVVYAFLSPIPMANLWVKITKEMRPGSLFISNSFPVPEHAASFVIEVNDKRGTRLFCYRV